MLYLLATDTCFGLACGIESIESYENIYQIKQRDAKKPLAIMVPDREWLAKFTDLNTKQIAFLKNYSKPFSVLTQSAFLQEFFSKKGFFNAESYQKFSLRVAHTPEQKKLISQIWPLFLTSANLSNQGEIYRVEPLRSTFQNQLSQGKIQEVWILQDLPLQAPSEIFAFVGEGIEQVFLRSA